MVLKIENREEVSKDQEAQNESALVTAAQRCIYNSGTPSRIHTRSGHSMPLVLEPPPFTPVEPITEVLHGVEITDPYRWLEDQNSPRTRKWIEEQTAYTRAYLDAIPGRETIRNRSDDFLSFCLPAYPS